MEWADDVANRPRRANAGSHLQELLQNGLDEEDERDLLELDENSSSDTSFTLSSDEETIDEVESDFDAEEVAGVLEGEAVETEATVRRAERQERQRERQKKLQRTQNFSKAAAHDRAIQKKLQQRQREKTRRQQEPRRKRERKTNAGASSDSSSASSSASSVRGDSSDDEGDAAIDLRRRVRHRPAPTIPCAQRLVEAHARAAARRAEQAALAEGAGDDSGAEAAATLHTHRGLNMGKARQRSRRSAGQRRHGGQTGAMADEDEPRFRARQPVPLFVDPRIALYGGPAQRVGYCSGVSVLQKYGVPTILSFSEDLPPVFRK